MLTFNIGRRHAVTAVAVATTAGLGTLALLSGEIPFANAAEANPSVSNPASAPAITLTAAQQRAQIKEATIAKYGVYPLPVKEKDVKKYRLNKKSLREIVKAESLANSSKARRVRSCESGGNYRTNTGNGYYGAYQFDYGTWLSNGGGRYARTANKAPKWAQDHIMWKTVQARGWSPWACQ